MYTYTSKDKVEVWCFARIAVVPRNNDVCMYIQYSTHVHTDILSFTLIYYILRWKKYLVFM
jgi:hypothetical protein